jgi:WD40 repeat protein
MNGRAHNMNPFPGLRAFKPDEDYLFFGREEQTIELLQRLANNRFVAVVGTSGSGKSSLVRCGLLSELLGGKMLQAGAHWEIAVTHPGGNPLALLTEALIEAELYDAGEEHVRESLLATLSRSHFGLVEAVRQSDLPEKTNFLLVVDQFEEIFRFHEAGQMQREAANEFIGLLLESVAQSEVPIYVVLTMRSDFIGECGQFEGLAEIVSRGEFLIPHLTREQYKRVIEGPIKVAKGKIAPRLLQRLLNDLGQQADQLPCLQHALMRTWNIWFDKGDSEALDLDDYQSVGRMTQALSLHADEIYDSLDSDRQRDLCRQMFQALTVRESENRGIRQPQRLGSLCQVLDVQPDELIPIIEAFRQPGVTFLMPPAEVELTDRTIIDISHESLMRVWTRLRHWVEEEAQAAGVYRRLSESATLHAQGEAGLYRDPELGIALAWREFKRPNAAWGRRYHPEFAEAMAFLDASQQAHETEAQARETARRRELEQAQELAEVRQQRLKQQQLAARKLRFLIAGLAVVAAIAGLACFAALIANNKANELADIASKQKDYALENAEKAKQFALEADRGRTAAQLAEQAMQQSALQAAAERNLAQRESYRSTILLAESMLKGDDDARFRVADTLWETQPELRGWEWGQLMARCPLEQWSLSTDPSGVLEIAATADGRRLVTAGKGGMVTLWDLESRRQVWQAQIGRVYKLVADPKNRFLAVSTIDQEALPNFRILDLENGRVVYKSEHIGKADIRLSPSGERLYVLDDYSVLRCYATTNWELSAQTTVKGLSIGAHQKVLPMYSLFVDAAGDCVGVFCRFSETRREHRFSFFDPRTLDPVSDLDGFQMPVSNTFSRSTPVLDSAIGEMLVPQLNNVHRKLWRGTQQVVCAMSEYVTYLAVEDDSGSVLAASTNGAVLIVDADGEEQTIMHGAPIAGLALLQRGRFVTVGADGLVKCWKLTPLDNLAYQMAAPTQVPGSAVLVSFSSDGKQLLYQNWQRSHQYLYEMDSLKSRGFARPDATATQRRFPRIRPGTNELIVNGDKGLVFLSPGSVAVDASSPELLSLPDPLSAALDASGRILVASSAKEQLAAWDLESNQQLPDPEVRGAGSVAVNSAGTRAAVRTTQQLQVWETTTGRRLSSLDCVDDGTSTAPDDFHPLPIVFHPDGELLAVVEYVTDSHSKLIVWDSQLDRTQATIPSPAGVYFGPCKFSTDGHRLFVLCSDEKVRIFDWRLGKELLVLSGGSNVDALDVSPDGRTIAYAGYRPNLIIAKSLPGMKETSRDVAFYQAVDELRQFAAVAAQLQSVVVTTLTNHSDKPIRADVVVDGKPKRGTLLAPGTTEYVPPDVSKGTTLQFVDPDSSEPVGSFITTDVPLEADEGPIGIRVSILFDTNPAIAETLGDVASRQAQYAYASAQYGRAIGILEEIVRKNPAKAAPQGRLATLTLQKLAADNQGERNNAAAVLQQASAFWRQLMEKPDAHPAGWRHLLRFQLQLVDHQITASTEDAQATLSDMLTFWAGQYAAMPSERPARDGFSQFCQRRSAAFPAEAVAILMGDIYAAEQQWERAAAMYGKRITSETKDASLLARRAEAFSGAGQWEPAAADWKLAIELDPNNPAWPQRRLASLEAGQRWTDVARVFSEELDGLPASRSFFQPRYQRIQTIIRRHDPVYEELRRLRPYDSLLPTSLARDAVLRSDWMQAAALYPLEPDQAAEPDEWFERAAALILADKKEEYHTYLKQRVEYSGETEDPFVAYVLARMVAISSAADLPRSRAVGWAELAAANRNEAWIRHVAGLAHYRAGNLEKALEWLELSADSSWHPELNQIALCLVHAQNGDMKKARSNLQQVREWLATTESRKKDGYYDVQPTDWLELHILLPEAEALLQETAQPHSPGATRPADSAKDP